jgi:predicted nucleic acid-binding protein
MTRFVLDSCVALKWVLPEADSAKAIRLRNDFQKAIHELIAPDIFEVEIAHALTRAERQGRIPVGKAIGVWTDIMSTPPDLHPSSSLIPRAIAISSAMRVGVYDCLYVALAEREKCGLITADDKFIKTLRPTFPFIVSLGSLP